MLGSSFFPDLLYFALGRLCSFDLLFEHHDLAVFFGKSALALFLFGFNLLLEICNLLFGLIKCLLLFGSDFLLFAACCFELFGEKTQLLTKSLLVLNKLFDLSGAHAR